MLRRTIALAFVVAGCSAAPAEEGSAEEETSESMDAISTSGCSTSTVLGLSEQLIAEANCIRPNTFARYTGAGITLASSAAFPYLQTSAASALRRAVAGGDNLTINSALRTLPQQYLLYTWYRRGQCGITLAARPGSSPHEKGLAIDTPEYSAWRGRLEAQGFKWHGAGDVVHFDYVGGGTTNITGLSVLAFQRLWNRNNPNDRIAEDGAYGPQTEARLAKAPSGGFARGACTTMAGPGSLTIATTAPAMFSPMQLQSLTDDDRDLAETEGLVSH